MITDDWDSVVDAYLLDQEKGLLASNVTNSLNDNACLRIIKTKYVDSAALEQAPNYSLKIHLIYNQSMHADILNNPEHFNQLKLCRYTMHYENLP